MKLDCCSHLDDRHLRFDDGTHVCLTGFCRCGKKPLKIKPKAEKKPSNLGKAYRQYKPREKTE